MFFSTHYMPGPILFFLFLTFHFDINVVSQEVAKKCRDSYTLPSLSSMINILHKLDLNVKTSK